jgi:hypothetical protein
MTDIIGAGMAGLLAANMMNHLKPTIYEKQKELPNNHSAVLRFRSSIVGDVLGLQFKKVTMIKGVVPWLNPVADALAYSTKNGGVARSDRSVIQGLVTDDRYIAPPDLIAHMASNANIRYGYDYFESSGVPMLPATAIISTIPMPSLMQVLQYPGRSAIKFNYRDGINLHANISDCDAYCSLLFPNPDLPFSRLSITGDDLIVEGNTKMDEDDLNYVALALGIDYRRFMNITRHVQRYHKINPIDDDARRDFIFWATTEHNVFSLGRFATWRPHLLLDDLVQDVRLIDKFIRKRDHYNLKRLNTR